MFAFAFWKKKHILSILDEVKLLGLNIGWAYTHSWSHDTMQHASGFMVSKNCCILVHFPDVQKITQLFYWRNVQPIPQPRGHHSVQVSPLETQLHHSFLISQLQFQLLLTFHSPGPSMALYLEWWCKLADIPSYPSLRVPTVQNTPISPYLFVYMLPWSLKCKWIKLSCCTSLQVCHFTTNGAWDQSFISLFT